MRTICIDCDGAGRYPRGATCKSCGGTGRVADGEGAPDPAIEAIKEAVKAEREACSKIAEHEIYAWRIRNVATVIRARQP